MELTCTACIDGTASDGDPCNVCGGDGVIDLIDDNFPRLIQQRRIAGIVWNEILVHITPLTNVFDSYVVLEELDATEHAVLTDAQKDGILHLLACGKVDLRDGKAGKVRLWNWFGAESTTVANLTALLT